MSKVPVELEDAIIDSIRRYGQSLDLAKSIVKHVNNRIENNFEIRDLEKIIERMESK